MTWHPDHFLKVQLVPGAHAPQKAIEGDAGYDLGTLFDCEIPGGSFMDVPTGIKAQLPSGFWGLIIGRSSTIRKRGLLVVQGVIDNGYRGELFIAVQNLGFLPVSVKAGERLAQLILFPLASPPVGVEEYLPESERGERGFGSTGV